MAVCGSTEEVNVGVRAKAKVKNDRMDIYQKNSLTCTVESKI